MATLETAVEGVLGDVLDMQRTAETMVDDLRTAGSTETPADLHANLVNAYRAAKELAAELAKSLKRLEKAGVKS